MKNTAPCIARSKTCKNQENGVALLAVLWLVAALSVMLIGLQKSVRGEIRIASQLRTSIINNGLADAAIRLTLQELTASNAKPIKSIQTKAILVFGNQVNVEIIPLNGYIDLNNAPITLLADAFEFGGELAKDDAQRLAASAVEARDRKTPDGLPGRFHATEDLLRITGFNYKVYAKLKNFLTVDLVGSGRVNPLAASAGTLTILAKGDQARAQQLLAARLSNPEFMDTTTLTAAHLEIAPSSYLLIRATTIVQDKTSLIRTWRVNVATPSYGLPWRVLGIDQSTATQTHLVN